MSVILDKFRAGYTKMHSDVGKFCLYGSRISSPPLMAMGLTEKVTQIFLEMQQRHILYTLSNEAVKDFIQLEAY